MEVVELCEHNYHHVLVLRNEQPMATWKAESNKFSGYMKSLHLPKCPSADADRDLHQKMHYPFGGASAARTFHRNRVGAAFILFSFVDNGTSCQL